MNVAVPWCQHSPMLGQRASSHTVFSFSSCMMPLSRTKLGEPGGAHLQPFGLGLARAQELDGGFDSHRLLVYLWLQAPSSRLQAPGSRKSSPLQSASVSARHHLVRALHVSRPHAGWRARAVRPLVRRQPRLSAGPEEAPSCRLDPGLTWPRGSHRRRRRRGARLGSCGGGGVRAVRVAGAQGPAAAGADEHRRQPRAARPADHDDRRAAQQQHRRRRPHALPRRAGGFRGAARGWGVAVLRRRHRALRRHAAPRRDAPAGDRLPADRRSLHDGARGGGDRVPMARGPAGDPDALGHVPGADRQAGRARGGVGLERRAGA